METVRVKIYIFLFFIWLTPVRFSLLSENLIFLISYLPQRHLGKANGLSLRKAKLEKDAQLLHYMDMAMQREGLDILAEDALDNVRFGLGDLGRNRERVRRRKIDRN